MSNQLIINLGSGSINDSSLGFIGDPSTGNLTQTSYHAMKDYFQSGITGSGGIVSASSGISTLSGSVILGQTWNEVGSPATLKQDAEIPMSSSFVRFTNTSPGLGGVKIGSGSLNTGINETSLWTNPPLLTLGGGLPGMAFNIDDYQDISDNPWGAASIVFRSKNFNMPTMSVANWGQYAGAGLEYHYATTNSGGTGYTSAMEFWLGYIDGTSGVILGLYGKGNHFAGTRGNPSVEIPFCINIGAGWTSYSGFGNTTGSFNLDASEAPINIWNLPSNPAAATSDSFLVLKSNGNVYASQLVAFPNAYFGAGVSTGESYYLQTPQLIVGSTTGGQNTQLELYNSGSSAANIENAIFFSVGSAPDYLDSSYPSNKAVFAIKSTTNHTVGTIVQHYLAGTNVSSSGLSSQEVLAYIAPDETLFNPTVAVRWRLTVGDYTNPTTNAFDGVNTQFGVDANNNPIYFKRVASNTTASVSDSVLVIKSSGATYLESVSTLLALGSGSGGGGTSGSGGTISGSGTNHYVPVFSGSSALTSSIVYASGSGTGSAILIGGNTTGSNNSLFQVYGNSFLSGSIYDSTGVTGSNGQVLSSTATGVKWTAATSGSSGTGSINSVTNIDNSLTFTNNGGNVTGSLNLANGNIFTAAQTISLNNIPTTESNALIVANYISASTGAQQISPSTAWIGQGWKTTATAGSQPVGAFAFVNPVQGTTNPSGEWHLCQSINGATASDIFVVQYTTGNTAKVTFSSTGIQSLSNSGGTGGISLTGNQGPSSNTITGNVGFTIAAANNASGNNITFTNSSGVGITGASGTDIGTLWNFTFAPTTGSATYADITLNGTINQTGAANGITRGVYIVPTISAVKDYRAIEVVTGKSIFQTVGIGGLNPTASGSLQIAGGNTTTAPLIFSSGSVLSTAVSGAFEYDATNAYLSFASGSSVQRMRLLGNGVPTIVSGSGAGTAPTITLTGNSSDAAMRLSVTTGTGPAGSNATIGTITYKLPYGSVPVVTFSAGNANAAALSGSASIYMDSNNSLSTFIIVSGTTALAAATTYIWNVHVDQ